MGWIHALVLGIVQGCTEFFPISSSAHLKIIKAWMQVHAGEETVFFDLACHLGTMVALLIYFRRDLLELISQPKEWVPYFVALLPLIPAYFLLKPLRVWASQPHLLGACLLITAVILFVAQKLKRGEGQTPSWKNALWIGAAQTVALIPGISRSAATITGGIWQGISVQKAVRFSFMLSIPAVAGGAFLEMFKLSNQQAAAWDMCAIGFGVSALTGLAVIRMAIPLLEKGFFRPFAWYCLIVAILITVVR